MTLSFFIFCSFLVSILARDKLYDINNHLSKKGETEYYFNTTASYPSGSCYTEHFKCLNNPTNLIKQFAAITPYDCCKTCLQETNCESWTHTYANATNHTQYVINEHPICELFSTFPNDTNHVYAGNCVMGTKYKSTKKRSNFVVYYPDTIKMESCSVYGHPLPTTPNMDRFVKDHGVIFDNHIAQHSQCSPSRMAMLSGRYMHVQGHRTQQHLIQYWEPSYLRHLKDSGYYVLWLGKNDALSVQSFPLTVNEWHNDIGLKSGPNWYDYPQVGYYSDLQHGSNVEPNDTANGDYKAIVAALDFLKNPIEPFIIFLPGKGGHPPYSAPKGFYDLYDPKQIEEKAPLRMPYPVNHPQYLSKTQGLPYWRNLTTFNQSFFYQLNSVYLGMISYMDYNFGQLWDGILQYDMKTNSTTSFIMSSDHGDFGGDYHLPEKYPGALDGILVNIPLVTRFDGTKVQNKRIKASTQSFDVFETILDVANVSIKYNRNAISLREQVIDGIEGDMNRYVFSEGGFYYHNELFPNGSDHFPPNECCPRDYPRAQEEDTYGSPRCVLMKDTKYKLVFRPLGVSEFYDLRVDGREENNLYGVTKNETYLDQINKMMMNLTEWFVLTADVTPILMDPRGIPKQVPN